MTGNTKAKFCSPANQNSGFTCFTPQSLIKIAKTWNKKHPTNQISSKLFGGNDTKKKLWAEIKKRLAPETCQNEHCWISSKIIKGLDDPRINYDTFIPRKPNTWKRDPSTWLSTLDIRYVLLQYESKYPEFEFIGPVPIDFDSEISFGTCVVEELCKINMKTLYKHHKTKIGIVFNLDPHDMPGSHWVSLFCDFTTGGIYYFDSVGKYPVPEIESLMLRLRDQGNQLLLDGVIPLNSISDDYLVTGKVKSIDSMVKIDHTLGKYLKDMPIILVPANSDSDSDSGNDSDSDHNNTEDNADKSIHQIIEIHKKAIQVSPEVENNVKNNIQKYEIRGFRVFFNDIGHQLKDTECGIYSIYFITSMLRGEKYVDFTHAVIRDEEMNTNRDVFYRPS